MQLFFSIIVPVYNRPDEVDELLESLTKQTYQHFEVIIVEDGSTNHCQPIVETYRTHLNIRYFFKENSGQGFSRNYGMERAIGDYFIFFDSDCLIPSHYLDTVNAFINENDVAAYGGPDRAHPTFTPIQKAISYAMTSFFTTGGIRGGKDIDPKKFNPRSFNMGFARKVFEKVGGFTRPYLAEDIEMSIRINTAGFTTQLIPKAYVYHKRRTSFRQFYKQVHFFGRARVSLFKQYPMACKPIYFLPALFIAGLLGLLTLSIAIGTAVPLYLPSVYYLLIFIDAWLIQKLSWKTALLTIPATFLQLTGYGWGFIQHFWQHIVLGKDNFAILRRG
ncbi:MAG: glycosyltransferase [Thermonemataceae bacterium]